MLNNLDRMRSDCHRDVDTFARAATAPSAISAVRPAGEAHEMNGGMNKIGAFCDFYKEQVNYAPAPDR